MRDLSKLPDGWRMVRLGDVVTMSQGGTPRKKRPEYWGGHIPFVTGADLRNVRVSREHARSFLSEDGLRSGDTVICEPGALLLATRTRVGLAGMATEVMGASQDITRVDPNRDVDPSYLCRLLVRNAPTLQRRARGTTIQGISRGDVESLPILVPPLSEQRGIAAVLDAIDEAIERTEAVIATTERLRDALLHELLTRGVPGWHSEWRDVSGLGTIPADWKVVRLGDVLDGGPTNGIYKPESEYGSGAWLIRIDDFVPGALVKTNGFQRIQATEEEVTRYAVHRGDILINRVNSLSHIGKSVLIPELDEPSMFESNMMKLSVCSDVHTEFAADFLLSENARSYFKSRAKKAVQQASINQQDVAQMSFPLPPMLEQRAIAAMLDGVDDATDGTREERNRLQSLKASAADALLTGRVRVNQDRLRELARHS